MNPISNNFAIVFYIFLWICILYYYIRRDKRVSLGLSLIMLYTVQAIVALIVLNSEFSDYNNVVLSLWPFVYLIFMLYLSMKPILDLKERELHAIEIPNSQINTSMCVFFAFFSIISIYNILPDIQYGFTQMLVSDSEGIMDLYLDSTEAKKAHTSFSGVFSLQGVISNMSNYITPLLFFTYYVKKNKSNVVMVLLLIALLQGPLTGIANASRQQLIGQIFAFFLLYFFFSPYMTHSSKNTFKRVGLIFVSILFMIFIIITIARSSQKSYQGNSLYNIESYFAQGPINFSGFCLDANGTREGNRIAPLFLQIMGRKVLSPEQIKTKYSYMRIDSSSFSTYVGDIVLDFGPYLAVVFFVVMTFVFSRMLKHKRRLSYGQVIIVFILVKICSGYYQFGFGGVGGNLAFIMLLTMSIIFLQKNNINNCPEIITRQS